MFNYETDSSCGDLKTYLESESVKYDSLKKLEIIRKNFDGRFIHNNVVVVALLIDYLKSSFKVYCEVGVHNGGSFCTAISQQEGGEYFGIDLFEDTYIKGYLNNDNISLNRTVSNIVKNNCYRNKFTLLRMDSRQEETAHRVCEYLGEQSISVLFLDGDHSFESVKRDFELYSRSVGKGGYIVFDDYDTSHNNHDGIKRFVDNIDKESYGHVGAFNYTEEKHHCYVLEKLF